ncbi:ATP-dependent protease HslVU (ClpYQ), peptidase subunit [Rubidibacter lacunae KORDI 51-2]|uniref:ATP-dependent protease HslVU (ClpYQ), peptidase subunit n=1 Tax=Rubidibacter lacunae KORDI 51-2 TaxID=582515 RepID=U5DJI0_9CHRO|nr:ATP-dependent protease HslVU (ClpYQ), peptidase subunit [Rubidibacter lacunae]ERN39845.1 ATP-dependent protease HslVU (ClpYQ), peptidase subunit [Rubidibacter lacunae KORDI 51-2]
MVRHFDYPWAPFRLFQQALITAVQKHDTVAIACDTLTTRTAGGLKTLAEYKPNASKLISYGDSIFGVCGSWAVKQIFTDLLERSEPTFLSSSGEIFRWLLSNQATLKSDYFMKTDNGNDKRQPTESQWLHAILANCHGIFVVTAYREVAEYSRFWAIGSGDRFALGALEVLYDLDLTAAEIAYQAALAATKFSPECAEPIIVETIPKKHKVIEQ